MPNVVPPPMVEAKFFATRISLFFLDNSSGLNSIWQNLNALLSNKFIVTALTKQGVDLGVLIFTQKLLSLIGTATTNNKGEFHFVTVYPPSMHDFDPHLNVRVEHFEMGDLQTRLILKGKKVRKPKLEETPRNDV